MFKNGLVFGREPVVVTAFLAAFLQVLSSLVFHWTDGQQAVVNAAISVLLGFAAAAGVAVDKALPALVGVVQAVLAVGIGFGLHLQDTQVSMITAMVAAGVALWTRDRVTAKVGAESASVVKTL
jgi:hypothetical protein